VSAAPAGPGSSAGPGSVGWARPGVSAAPAGPGSAAPGREAWARPGAPGELADPAAGPAGPGAAGWARPGVPDGLDPPRPRSGGGAAPTGGGWAGPSAGPGGPPGGAPGRPAQRRRDGAWLRRELLELAIVVLLGTGVTAVADALVGRLDGKPQAYLLVALALPFWDLLPRRLPLRLGAVALLVAALAAAWFGIAMLRPQPWWRAEAAFGLACALVGTGHLLVATVGRRRVTP
jgi:hypothetical protein